MTTRSSWSRPQRARADGPVPAGWRAVCVMVAIVLGFMVVALRAYGLQVRDRDFLAAEGERRHVRTLIEPGGRGAIRDRHGAPLALSAPVESVWTVPSELLASPHFIPSLAELLGQDAGQLHELLAARASRQFVYLRRHMAPADARRVLALQAPGVFLQREYRRFYPAGEVVAQLVGMTDIDGRGQEGMERAYEASLNGVSGYRQVIKDRVGRVVEDLAEFVPAEAGMDLDLSIDLRLQHFAYRELKSAVTRHRAKGGVILIVDVRSGEILALATQPGFNPNDRADMARNRQAWRNRAALDLFEPGSTVKPLVVAAALQAGVIAATDRIRTDGGALMVGRLRVSDFRDYGTIDLATLLAKSSNVGAAKLGLQLGAGRLHEMYRALGFGQESSVGFPAESAGRLLESAAWGQVGTATASYGYGLSVTSLQLVQAYMALAADGRLRRLSLLKNGASVEAPRVLEPRIATQVRGMMTGVTELTGTGRRAAVAGYEVAGKTGTVRKVRDGEYRKDKHQAMFVGMLPARAPQLLGLVMIDEPAAGDYYGGVVAAPVFGRVAEAAARLLQVAPQGGQTGQITARAGGAAS